MNVSGMSTTVCRFVFIFGLNNMVSATVSRMAKRAHKKESNRISKNTQIFFSAIIMPQYKYKWMNEIKINGFYWCISCLSYLNAGMSPSFHPISFFLRSIFFLRVVFICHTSSVYSLWGFFMHSFVYHISFISFQSHSHNILAFIVS